MGVWVYDRGGGLVFAESQPTKHPPTPLPNIWIFLYIREIFTNGFQSTPFPKYQNSPLKI